MDARFRAIDLLTHYFRTVFEAAGLSWDADHASEVEELVDALRNMVREEISDHVEQAPHSYPDGSAA
jgi:hypothetical protein